jgi:hypothetical protein
VAALHLSDTPPAAAALQLFCRAYQRYRGEHPSAGAKGVLGGAAAFATMAATMPLENVMRRLQVQGRPGFPRRYTGPIDCAARMAREEGLRAFWRGSLSSFAKVRRVRLGWRKWRGWRHAQQHVAAGCGGCILTSGQLQATPWFHRILHNFKLAPPPPPRLHTRARAPPPPHTPTHAHRWSPPSPPPGSSTRRSWSCAASAA